MIWCQKGNSRVLGFLGQWVEVVALSCIGTVECLQGVSRLKVE